MYNNSSLIKSLSGNHVSSLFLLYLFSFQLLMPAYSVAGGRLLKKEMGKNNYSLYDDIDGTSGNVNTTPGKVQKKSVNPVSRIGIQTQEKAQKEHVNESLTDNILNSSVSLCEDNEASPESPQDPGAGPTSPDFSSFESVSTDNMINPFSGDFSYNLPVLEIPGAHNGGYALSLSYNNVTNPDEEASWVGLGWTLNPGAITRNKRGFPDDLKEGEVEYINETPANWTIGLSPNLGIEAFTLKASLTKNMRYNNYKGFGGGYTANISALNGLVSLGYTMDDGKGSFSPGINPSAILGLLNTSGKKAREESVPKLDPCKYRGLGKNEGMKAKRMESAERMKAKKGFDTYKQTSNLLSTSTYNFHSFSDMGSPSNVTEFDGVSTSFSIEGSIDPSLVIVGVNGGLIGSYTRQTPKSQVTRQAYGYIYSNYADLDSSSTSIMDYHVEKESPFMLRDQFTPVPISDADYFNVSGEGISGGFRAYWKKPGLFSPPSAHSQTLLSSAGVELHAGTDLGAGGSGMVGEQNLRLKSEWDNNGNSDDMKYTVGTTEDEPYVFRMNNDLGGNVMFSNNFDNIKTNLDITGSDREPNISSVPATTLAANERIGRSTHIRAFTNEQINSELTAFNANTLIPAIIPDNDITEDCIDRSVTEIKDHIGIYSLTNEEGTNYVYALPVYNRNEESMQYNVPNNGATAAQNDGKEIIHTNVLNGIMTGEKHKYAYPASYLLTSIRSADYADVNNNGEVDKDDLGGFTKFDYVMKHGHIDKTDASSPWYEWRVPYTGLRLNQNKLFDLSDDMGSYSYGEKEVYYLKTIETKTHVAVFVTNLSDYSANYGSLAIGSQQARSDGKSAVKISFGDPNAAGTDEQEYLEKILLFAKYYDNLNALQYKLVKTVKMNYNYEAWPMANNTTSGKLTLKKVWVENNNIVEAKNSPFEFEYQYPDATVGYPTPKYDHIKDFYANYSTAAQSPLYPDARYADRWGNYQIDGESRKEKLIPYVSQKNNNDFDPAAWNLKQIKLPTGAEIHVQYEQDDYLYVQNEKATAMVSITSAITSGATNTFKINLEDIYPTGGVSVADYTQFLKDNLLNQYVYFKFLYTLNGVDMVTLPLGDNVCNAEYIDGYVLVTDIVNPPATSDIEFTIGGGAGPVASIANQPFNTATYKYPRYVCYDYIKTETGWQAGYCDIYGNGFSGAMGEADPKAILAKAITSMKNRIDAVVNGASVCGYINPELSYFRLPIMPTESNPGKKGGGLRVKRLLMYDAGMETDHSDEALYGTEYIYKDMITHTSFGVASNEPPEGKEENPLIDFIQKRDEQKWSQKVLSGKDKEQFEGPYGESLLPSASVGYSRVVSKSIHSGKTDVGFSVSEFYTTKDYPTLSDEKTYMIDGQLRSPVDIGDIVKAKKMQKNYCVFVNVSKNQIWATQGYRFFINSMNGKPKSESRYTGAKEGVVEGILNFKKNKAVVYHKEYTYYQPGEKVPVTDDALAVPTLAHLGVETEIISERKQITDISENMGLSIDAAVSLTVPLVIPTFSGMMSVNLNESKHRTFVTNKVIYLPAILKSTTETKDGITHTTENMAFSKVSGQAIVTRSYDVYDNLDINGSNYTGKYYTYNQPACNVYPGMNQKAINENRQFSPTAGTNDAIALSGVTNLYDWVITGASLNYLSLAEGDLMKFSDGSDYYFYIKSVIEAPAGVYTVSMEKFDQSFSYPTNITFTKLNIIKSGKTNQVNTSVGNIVTYNEIALPLTVATVPSGVLSARNTVITNINSSGIANNVTNTPNAYHELYSSIADKSFLAGPGNCFACGCEQLYKYTKNEDGTDGYTLITPKPECEYKLVTWMCGEDLYLGILDKYRQATLPLYTYATPPPCLLPSNIVLYPSALKCSTNNDYVLLNYQKLGLSGGTFLLDPVTQYKILYQVPGEEPIDVTLLKFCTPDSRSAVIEDVVTNKAATFRQKWDFRTLNDYPVGVSWKDNEFNKNIRGKWRVFENFGYKEDRTSSNVPGTAKVYNTGLYTLGFNGWRYPALGDKWVKASQTDAYSPFGEAVQERDAIDIPSASAYSNDKTQPVLVANNADHNSISFESFEQNTLTNTGTYTPNFDLNYAHAGDNSVILEGNVGYLTHIDIPIVYTNKVLNEEMVLKFWASSNPAYAAPVSGTNPQVEDIRKIRVNISPNGSGFNATYIMANKISSSGVWSLYEAIIPTNVPTLYSPQTPPALGDVGKIKIQNRIDYINGTGGLTSNSDVLTLYLDDIRLQPKSSSMTAYVYDIRSKKLVTSFDDRHFGLFYLYNADGKLVRKLAETERGMKMLDERQYNNAKKMNYTKPGVN